MPESAQLLASRLGAYLHGWLSQLAAVDLLALPREDALRLKAAELLKNRRLSVSVNEPFPNANIGNPPLFDLGLKAAGANAQTWYGFVELKWPSAANPNQSRPSIVQDAVRLAAVDGQNLFYRLLVLAGPLQSIDGLYAPGRANRLEQVLSTDPNNPNRQHARADLQRLYPNANQRVPQAYWNRLPRLATILADSRTVTIAGNELAKVMIWVCRRNL